MGEPSSSSVFKESSHVVPKSHLRMYHLYLDACNVIVIRLLIYKIIKSCPYEHPLYVKTNKDGDIVIVCLYVDDFIFTGNNLKFYVRIQEDIISQFEMTDIESMSYFLGIEVKQTDKGIFILQKKYAEDILKKYKMKACKPILTLVEERLKLVKDGSGGLVNATNFRRLVGSVRYLIATRPDIIVYGVGIVSRFNDSPQQSYWEAPKQILRYIKGTLDDGIIYKSANNMKLVGCTDSDWTGDIEKRKSTSGNVFHLGSGAISSKKQQVVTL
ncbi:hypothetical protein RJ640_007749 [Escallonia rubra]|uniref:Reverse transcriptase Ty1/copia-type domain-containing protein n=1 Tax=Escallonia rubra TaxID=112253 RepID=A0AA88R1C6_9ASTE|nr:hypothetical protein RJ640_007749 [Escallonia rubra]